MKNQNYIVKVLLLVTVYCFGIYGSASTLPFSNDITYSQENEHSAYLTSSSKILSPHSQQTEVSISDVAESLNLNFKLPFTSFNPSQKLSEVFFNTRFKQYKIYANTLLIRHRKSDLIFPFHNFW